MLARVTDVESGSSGQLLYKAVWVWCPGCDELHQFIVELFNGYKKPVWGWNGSVTSPTFEPSHLVTWAGLDDSGNSEKRVCHCFLRDGVWDFLSDSTHKLAGKKVPMVDLPDWLVKE